MQCFYLNLDHRVDRRVHMEAQLAAAGLSATRISAATPADMLENVPELISNAMAESDITSAELACNFSHFRAFQAILDTGDTCGLVLEDDVLLGPDVQQAIATLTPLLDTFDIIKLETRLGWSRLKPQPDCTAGPYALHQFFGFQVGAAGYLISTKAIGKVMNFARCNELVIDRLLFDPASDLRQQLNVGQVVPAPIFHPPDKPSSGVHKSDLESHRQHRKDRCHQGRFGQAIDTVDNLYRRWLRTINRRTLIMLGYQVQIKIPFTGRPPETYRQP